MKNYAITIKEILSKTVVTKADSLEDAIIKVSNAYHAGKIEIDLDVNEVIIDESEYCRGEISDEEATNRCYERFMDDKEILELAQEIARAEYEEENGTSWDEADKYEREDWVWSVFERLKGD